MSNIVTSPRDVPLLKISVAEAEERGLHGSAFDARFQRWYTCGLCEQQHHGVVACALGWGCWKTYLGRPETDFSRQSAITQLSNGLYEANLDEDALAVSEADLAMMRRLGASEEDLLVAQGNIASVYHVVGRREEALPMRQEVYSGTLRLRGEEHEDTLLEATNYALTLRELNRFEDAKSLLLQMIPVARRALGETHTRTLKMRCLYAVALYREAGATFDDLREAVATLEETARNIRRVLGGTHPTTLDIERDLQDARAALREREASSGVATRTRAARARRSEED